MSTYRRHAALGLAAVMALAAGWPAAADQLEFSSAVREHGRATVEYRDEDIHVVAAYGYSQQNHDSRWIMIRAGVSTTASTVIARSAIALRTPEGHDIPLATQREVGADRSRIRALLQNASAVVHDVTWYFVQRDRVEAMRLFDPAGGGIVHNDFLVDRDHVAVGSLFFASPTGAWERGTYALVVRHAGGTAMLPIRLE